MGTSNATLKRRQSSQLENSFTQLNPSMSQTNAVVSEQERELSLLTKANLLRLMAELKRETGEKYCSLKAKSREERSNFMVSHAEWGYAFEDLCQELKENLSRMILNQAKKNEEELKEVSQNFLEESQVDQKVFERSVLHYGSDPTVVSALELMSIYSTPKELDLTKLLEICVFRSKRYEQLNAAFSYPNNNSKHSIMKTIISDETYYYYQIEEEELVWAIGNMSVEENDPLIQEFKKLKYLY